MKIQCVVMPKSQKVGVRSVELQNDQYNLRVALSSPPEKNKANQELIDILSKIFCVKKCNISLILGRSNRKKLILMSNLSEKDKENIMSKLIFLSKQI